MNILVLGLGNLLLADEGVGVHAARALLLEGLPPDTEILDIGTAVLDALPALERANRIILMDAVKAGGKPGTLYRFTLDGCRTTPHLGSMHGFDISRVIALTGRGDLPEVVVLGVEPSVIGWSTELSPPVAEALPSLLEAVKKEMIAAPAHLIKPLGER